MACNVLIGSRLNANAQLGITSLRLNVGIECLIMRLAWNLQLGRIRMLYHFDMVRLLQIRMLYHYELFSHFDASNFQLRVYKFNID